MIKDILQLINKIQELRLSSIEFIDNNLYIIKKQIGNTTGTKIEITFNNDKKIININVIIGGYSSAATIRKEINKLLEIIEKA